MTTATNFNVGALWRRTVQTLAQAFDPAREVDEADTVFQPHAARERAKPNESGDSAPASNDDRQSQETLQ